MARYDSKRKLERNMALIEYFTTHPSLSLSEVGKAFSITRQRVWQLIKKEEEKLGYKIERMEHDA